MSNISVAEILKMHGSWIEGKPFASLIHEKLGITERQAYNLMKKAWDNAEIVKIPLPNRTVLYGLPEFGAPQKKELSMEHSEKEHVTESELDRAKALQIMKSIQALIGANALTKEDWDYFNQDNGKTRLDKARALLNRKGSEALGL